MKKLALIALLALMVAPAFGASQISDTANVSVIVPPFAQIYFNDNGPNLSTTPVANFNITIDTDTTHSTTFGIGSASLGFSYASNYLITISLDTAGITYKPWDWEDGDDVETLPATMSAVGLCDPALISAPTILKNDGEVTLTLSGYDLNLGQPTIGGTVTLEIAPYTP